MRDENINIEILYESKTTNILFNKEGESKELYNDFIKQIKKELDIKNDKAIFKLLTMNTKEIYSFVNEDNFAEIINEKTKEGKIQLFLEIEDEKDNVIEPLGEGMFGGINDKIDEDDDFNDKINLSNYNDIVIINDKKELDTINEKDKKMNEKKELDLDENNKIDDKTDNIIFNDNNRQINNNKNDPLKEDKLITSIKKDDVDYIKNDDKKEIKEQINVINENNEKNEINQIDEGKNSFSIEVVNICTICKKVIKDNIKYECCLCDKCILCQNCEENHDHPCIKFKIKTNFLSNLSDCHSFITQKHNFSNNLPISYIKNIFNNTYDIILQLCIDNHIEIRPNKSFEIPILIKNYSELPITADDFILIIKNYTKINVKYEIPGNTIIHPKNYLKVNLNCTSNDDIGREIINIEVYSSKIKIRESKYSNFNIEILVSNDEEDEELNKKFIFYPKIQLLNKLRKKMLIYIFDNHFCEKSITQIYDCLCENNWNLDTAINQLNNQI